LNVSADKIIETEGQPKERKVQDIQLKRVVKPDVPAERHPLDQAHEGGVGKDDADAKFEHISPIQLPLPHRLKPEDNPHQTHQNA
jgi:hypothetical protein